MLTPLWAKRVDWAKTQRSSTVHAFDNPGALRALCGAFRGPWDEHRYHQHLACKRCARIAKGRRPSQSEKTRASAIVDMAEGFATPMRLAEASRKMRKLMR